MNDIQDIFDTLKWIDAASFLKQRREELENIVRLTTFDYSQHSIKEESIILTQGSNLKGNRLIRPEVERKVQTTNSQLYGTRDENLQDEFRKLNIMAKFGEENGDLSDGLKFELKTDNESFEKRDKKEENQNENGNQPSVSSFFEFSENDKGNTQIHVAAFSGDSSNVFTLLRKDHNNQEDSDDNRESLSVTTKSSLENGNKLDEIKGKIKSMKTAERKNECLGRKDKNDENQKEYGNKSFISAAHFITKEWEDDASTQLAEENNTIEISVKSFFEFSENGEGNTPIHAAAFKGDSDSIVALLQKDPNLVNKTNEKHWTPLHYAAAMGHLKVLLILLESGANVMARATYTFDWITRKGTTATHFNFTESEIIALHLAADQGHIDIVEALIEYNATMVNVISKHNSTPLHCAAWEGHTKTVIALLQKGANVNAKFNYMDDHDGTEPSVTALHAAARKGHVRTVQTLLYHHADSSVQEHNGHTALHLAAQYGKTSTVIVLTEHDRGLVHLKNNFKFTPLHLAASNGYPDTIMALLDKGANINAKGNYSADPDGTEPLVTALHVAALNGHVEAVQTLLRRHADSNLKDRDDSTALHRAAQNGKTSTVIVLIEHDYGLVHVKNNSNWTPLHLAASNGYVDAVIALLDKGANINAKGNYSNDPDGTETLVTALHVAALNGHVEAVQTLLRRHADSNLKDRDGDTALHLAVSTGKTSTAIILAEHDSGLINIKNNDKKSALEIAIQKGYKELASAMKDKSKVKNDNLLSKFTNLLSKNS